MKVILLLCVLIFSFNPGPYSQDCPKKFGVKGQYIKEVSGCEYKLKGKIIHVVDDNSGGLEIVVALKDKIFSAEEPPRLIVCDKSQFVRRIIERMKNSNEELDFTVLECETTYLVSFIRNPGIENLSMPCRCK